ncbi:CoA transferase [Janibacter cremeus]|uniref:Crotonobetainyl-CoA:carnitine CoA-transferase CaiB-like acyl-CoA transferase n=1 Tax=Janibacter cremeus TaxID=1285192 RepID=A0A852VWP3_9MICO|nr:CoA transferase [Janibacter cremeus]NYF98195.1 crotonobetainyl-CoA:carnitine CoA-transferase CaiB-like acyl-CoA transferase [Janibacter cremeus]
MSTTDPLAGVRVLSIAINLPGPAAVARLARQGASVTTVLPPSGDPMEQFARAYFDELHVGQDIRRVDLKSPAGLAEVDELLAAADVFVTSSRPSALRRLGLDFANVHERHPQVCQVDIVGYPGEQAEVPGHDLTYQAVTGMVRDGRMPATLVVDLAGSERAAAEASAALVQRGRTGEGSRREVPLSDLAHTMSRPVAHGLTVPGGLLAGDLPVYSLYAAADGHIAVAALEPHFTTNLLTALGLAPEELTRERLGEVFAGRTASQWEQWASEHDLPLVAVAG